MTELLVRLKLEPPTHETANVSALAWEEMLRKQDPFARMPRATTWRRVVMARSYTAPRYRLPQIRLNVALAKLSVALYRTGILCAPDEDNHIIRQQVPSDHDFVEVAIYEPCDSQVSAAVEYRRRRGVR